MSLNFPSNVWNSFSENFSFKNKKLGKKFIEIFIFEFNNFSTPDIFSKKFHARKFQFRRRSEREDFFDFVNFASNFCEEGRWMRQTLVILAPHSISRF